MYKHLASCSPHASFNCLLKCVHMGIRMCSEVNICCNSKIICICILIKLDVGRESLKRKKVCPK